MAQQAAHLVDYVLPKDTPYRQWVLTLPYDLRLRAAYDPKVMDIVTKAFVGAVQGYYEDLGAVAGLSKPSWGGVSVVQRFGSAIQLTPHVHLVGIDGAFDLGPPGARTVFHPLISPGPADVDLIVRTVAKRVMSGLRRAGLLTSEDPPLLVQDSESEQEPVLAACYAGAATMRVALGEQAGQRLTRLGQPTDDPELDRTERPAPLLGAKASGFDLHAGVTVKAGDRDQLERLIRYICRPALSHDRLELTDDGRVSLRLKTAFSDGSTRILLRPDELIERLCALVPRPRKHRLRYHGLLAPAAKGRSQVVPARVAPRPGTNRRQRPWIPWAALLLRVFSFDPLVCPKCSGSMKILSAIAEAKVIRKILACYGQPVDPPRILPARSPPGSDLDEIVYD